jgi:hypothetical protein
MTGQRLSQWIALRCKEPLFWRFLQVKDEPTAIHMVRTLCEVASRSEFDSDPLAAERLHQIIRRPFVEFTQENEPCLN